MGVITQDPEHADHNLVPLVCGHTASIFNRSSFWDFPEDGETCRTCHEHQQLTPEALAEIEAWQDADPIPEVYGTDILWEKVGEEPYGNDSRLLAHIVICGVDMHLEAYWVVEDNDGLQVSLDPELDAALRSFSVASGAEGHWQVARIEGKDYVIVATPYC